MRAGRYLILSCLFALAIFLPGIDWGLPSRNIDRQLFGDRTPWTGAEILALLESDLLEDNLLESDDVTTSQTSSTRGADVDANPILDRTQPIVVNATDRQRAEIVQRYRLMSRQPDEFIQFKALAEMAGRDGIDRLDPRLYQYGGLWMYPVGALLKICDLLGVVELRSDRAFYLDHPEKFGRFYVVARLYSVFWGCVAVMCVTWMAWRMTGRGWLSVGIAMLFATSPMVLASAQDAKPHLAGCALMLLACVCAWKWIDAQREHRHGMRWAILAGVCGGAAGAMVLSAVWAVLVVPMMAWLGRGASSESRESSGSRDSRESRRAAWRAFAFASVAGGLTFVLSNPFLVFNTLFRRELVTSNLGNSAAMYGTSGVWRSVSDAFEIASAGLGLLLWVALIGFVVSVVRRIRRMGDTTTERTTTTGLWLMLPTVGLTGLVFVLLAGGKPLEYARFALPLAAFAPLFVASYWHGDRTGAHRWSISQQYVVVAINLGVIFAISSVPRWNRVATNVPRSLPADSRVGLWYEPAPWSLKPIDLFETTLVLLPAVRGGDPLTVLDETSAFQRYDLAFVRFPGNLGSQVGAGREYEQISWRRNREHVMWEHDDGVILESIQMN